ncbi:hypothetical protein CKA32_004658 [Geitlerinema sp. FC II]|nr:hypothetical protein [Geitlerinema sp. CS-897]PPT07453.1 hypothetical protein CKA32_004658 [Geitlerinema sp. FC II]
MKSARPTPIAPDFNYLEGVVNTRDSGRSIPTFDNGLGKTHEKTPVE